MDFGPAAGLAVEYKRVGIQASYYYGLANYIRKPDYLPNAQAQVYSRYLPWGFLSGVECGCIFLDITCT
jgi:hypothetical protein